METPEQWDNCQMATFLLDMLFKTSNVAANGVKCEPFIIVDNTYRCPVHGFNPAYDAEHMLMVIEAMAGKLTDELWYFEIHFSDKVLAMFSKVGISVKHSDEDIKPAVCIAAAKALLATKKP